MITVEQVQQMDYLDKIDLILANQSKLFWLITTIPGVARYAKDVQHFVVIDVSQKKVDEKEGIRIVNGYRNAELKVKIDEL